MGLEGFTGNESILYHLESPCRVKELGAFTPIEREEWVPETHAHRLQNTYDVPPEGDEIAGRRTLMWNSDVEISFCRPERSMDYFFRNGEGDEVVFVHEGRGTLETDLRRRSLQGRRLRRHPARNDVPLHAGGAAALPRLRDAGAHRDPAPLPQPVRPDPRGSAVLPPRHPPAHRARTRDGSAATSSSRCACAAGTRSTSSTTTPSTSSAGTASSTRGRSRSTTSSRSRAASTSRRPPTRPSRGRTSSSARSARGSSTSIPEAVPIPYHHSNLQSEEMIYYVSGNFGSRKGISVGAITLHPSGLPHGPQPGLAEKSLGVAETTELAVMCDTFRPLKLSTLARDLDDGRYALLVVRAAVRRAESRRRDEPPVVAWTPTASSRSSRGSSTTIRARSIRSTGASRRSPKTSRTWRARTTSRCSTSPRAASTLARPTSRSASSTARASSRRCSATRTSGSSGSTASSSATRRSRRSRRTSRASGSKRRRSRRRRLRARPGRRARRRRCRRLVLRRRSLLRGAARGPSDRRAAPRAGRARHRRRHGLGRRRLARWTTTSPRKPRARRILTIDGKSRGAPQWWEGMQVLVWDG